MTAPINPLRKFFSDKEGELAIGQTPNAPLIIWLFFAILSHFLHDGWPLMLARYVSKTALIVWAVLEVYSGASPFRRVLGVVVLAFSIVSLL